MKAKLGAALLLQLFAVTASEAATFAEDTINDLVQRGVSQVERAFNRRQSQLDTAGLQPAAPGDLAQLFPTYGFIPTGTRLTFSLTALDALRTQVCARYTATTLEEWRGAVVGFSMKGMSLMDSTCGIAVGQVAPTAYPANVYALEVLDSQNVPTRTVLPGYPAVSGASSSAVANPSIVLSAIPGQWSDPAVITITNPPVVVSTNPVTYQTTGIAAITARPGFEITHACSVIAAGDSCNVTIRYQGVASEGHRVGNIRIQFTTGEVAVIGLRGDRSDKNGVKQLAQKLGGLPPQAQAALPPKSQGKNSASPPTNTSQANATPCDAQSKKASTGKGLRCEPSSA